MGCCLVRARDEGKETEMTEQTINVTLTCKAGCKGKGVTVNDDTTSSGFKLSGKGVLIGSCPLDCDTARWEVVIGKLNGGKIDIGVKRYHPKTPCNLDNSLPEGKDDANSQAWFLEDCSLKEGDVVGIYWDQTDFPMLSFTLNGTLLRSNSISRIRPSSDVYPAVSVSGGEGSCTVIFNEKGFRFPSISSKFKMIICSSSIL